MTDIDERQGSLLPWNPLKAIFFGVASLCLTLIWFIAGDRGWDREEVFEHAEGPRFEALPHADETAPAAELTMQA